MKITTKHIIGFLLLDIALLIIFTLYLRTIWTDYLLGLLLGFIIAITGSWKDTLFERFEPVKFFRSPIVTWFWYIILLLSLPNENLILILLSSATLERLSIEIYKGVRRQPPGKFKRKQRDSGWLFERLR